MLQLIPGMFDTFMASADLIVEESEQRVREELEKKEEEYEEVLAIFLETDEERMQKNKKKLHEDMEMIIRKC